MSANDPELIAEFVTESNEHLADIENQLLEIETSGANIDVELVNTVFRGVHSIKGVASFLGLANINQLAHCLEDVLNRIRNQQLVPTSAIVDVMLKAADVLRSMVADPENSNDTDITLHLDELAIVLSDNDEENDAGAEEPTADEPESVEPRKEQDVSDLADTAMDTVSRELVEQPADIPNESPESEPMATETAPPKPEPAPVSRKAPAAKTESAANAERSSAPQTETSIRVSVSTLDLLMNLAGELVLNRNRLVQHAGSHSDSELASLSSDIDHNTCELQEAIMQTRMQPIATAFNRFPRIVRDLSSKLKKECNLVIEGKDVEVDKSIIESIGDPLTHLIRNSVDHGIESPEARVAASKPPIGTVQLSAYHRAGQVCIDISDDGGGIDAERLKQKAVEKDILTELQAAEMGKREALRLVFHPGFSTAEKLTDVSGRGVGMDVVRTNIERIGGTVDVESEIGAGTTIRIVLPLTLAIIRSLIIGCHTRRFAIPQVNVAELVRIPGKERGSRINKINDATVFRLRGDLVPLVDLFDTLELGKGSSDGDEDETRGALNAISIVVLETGRSRYGIIVDEMHDSEEIVVKPLGRHLKQCPTIAGATILGDGRVALILDAGGIADKVNLNSLDEAGLADEQNRTLQDSETQKLLLFRNAPDERFAIPMGLVARIERVSMEQIEDFHGKLVTQYRGGTLPLISVENTVSANPRPECDYVSVVVLNSEVREYGLIAPDIEDIRNLPVDVNVESLQERGIIGSQVIDGVTTRILDVFQMLEDTFPSAIEKEVAKISSDPDRPKTVLVAEDSRFFRKQVVGFLEEANYHVVEAEDGAIAWNLLLKEKENVDIVVTDIEMPNMNGLEFSKKIRSQQQFQDMPIVALTSLANEDDIQRGLASGINEYQVKMDRETLLNAIHRLTKC